MTTIWYPASGDVKESVWRIGGFPGLPLFLAGQSALDAAPIESRAKLPLVMLSHGTGGASAQHAWIADELAANGYVVAAVNHHGNTALEETYQAKGFVLWWERARDLTFALDELVEDEVFGPLIDRSSVAAVGFSLGGYSVLALGGALVDLEKMEAFCAKRPDSPSCTVPSEAPYSLEDILELENTDGDFRESMALHSASYRDPRIKAVYALAPGVAEALTAESLERFTIPVRIAVGENDEQAIPSENGELIARRIPGAEFWLIPRAAHYTFLAECGVIGRFLVRALCVDPPGVDRKLVHEEVAQDITLFLDRALAM